MSAQQGALASVLLKLTAGDRHKRPECHQGMGADHGVLHSWPPAQRPLLTIAYTTPFHQVLIPTPGRLSMLTKWQQTPSLNRCHGVVASQCRGTDLKGLQPGTPVIGLPSPGACHGAHGMPPPFLGAHPFPLSSPLPKASVAPLVSRRKLRFLGTLPRPQESWLLPTPQPFLCQLRKQSAHSCASAPWKWLFSLLSLPSHSCPFTGPRIEHTVVIHQGLGPSLAGGICGQS